MVAFRADAWKSPGQMQQVEAMFVRQAASVWERDFVGKVAESCGDWWHCEWEKITSSAPQSESWSKGGRSW